MNSPHKSIAILCFFMCICCYCIPISLADAADGRGSKHISTGRILEFSLKNLKQSLQKTKQKNDRLTFENAAIRNDVQYLKRILENLFLKKSELLGEPPMFPYQEDRMLFAETFDRKERERRTDELIAIFERDVFTLQEEIQLLDQQLDWDRFNAQKQLLSDKKKESQRNYSKLEKRLKALDASGRNPKKTIRELEGERSVLERKLTILQNKISGY